MTELVASLRRLQFPKIEAAWLVVLAILVALAILDPAQVKPSLIFTARALANTAPYIAFAVLAVAYLKASGAEAIVARAFEGRQVRMIVLAAAFGGLSPFCSCEVIPFIAGLLALGTPVAPVMAFWLASPLMDPPAFLITAGALGWQFAIAKTIAAVGVGLLGGFVIYGMTRAGWFANPLRPQSAGGCCGCGNPFKGKTYWRFWEVEKRREVFAKEALGNALFLVKWLTLAYLIESLMLKYIPAEMIAGILGGPGLLPIVTSAVVGAPAYLNSYAAPPLVSGLMAQGMSPGAAMSFMIAGGVSSIPAMTAVFALVTRRLFLAYILLGMAGAILSGVGYGVAVSMGYA